MIHVFGGGTVSHVRNHLALCAPAYGETARKLYDMLRAAGYSDDQVKLELTRMADSTSRMETNQDVANRVNELLADPKTRAIVFNVALCDFEGQIGDVVSGKYAARLKSREGLQAMTLAPAAKVLGAIKAARPDIFVVGFKTTADSIIPERLALAERQIRETGVDLVLANDTVTRKNLLVWRSPRDQSIQKMLTPTRQDALSCVASAVRKVVAA